MKAPWHHESYTHFANETLPTLLETYLGIERAAEALAALTLPSMTEAGVLEGAFVVLPRASAENLEEARITCVGEQLTERLDTHLSGWHDSALPPLESWLSAFLTECAQPIDSTNPLATYTHLRRLIVEGPITGWHPSHVGRACAVENPEGPNTGRILTVALGARIENGAVLPGDTPLGLSASCIPFLAHTSDARALMGANMYRQWQRLPAAEPALVRTGEEPTEADFWCGVNLRTAFIPWGRLSHEDALILSESAARRLTGPTGRPLAIGDKLANRHGAKGIVGAILPEHAMPHGAEDQAIELIYPFFGVPSRMNHGQLLEAALGAAVARDGQPGLAAPFAGPRLQEIQARRVAVGLSEDGLEQLKSTTPLARRSATGLVYWGRLAHDAADKLTVGGQTLGPTEYAQLREAGADAVLLDFFSGWGKTLLHERLEALGMGLTRTANGLQIGFTEPAGETLALGDSLAHPWLPEHLLTKVGVVTLPEFAALRSAAERLERMKASAAPSRLIADAKKAIEARLWDYTDALLPRDVLAPHATLARSGRSVCAPAPWPEPDQIGLPAPLFEACSGAAWVLVQTAPHALVALQPVCVDGDAIRFPVQLCSSLDTDFDGDPLAVFAPSTLDAAEELGRLFSPAGLLRHDPSRLTSPYGGFLLGHGALYGLAELARTTVGLAEISTLLGRPLAITGLCLRRADLEKAVTQTFAEDGPEAALSACARLAEAGFAVAQRSGASLSPFVRAPFPSPPNTTEVRAWEAWGVALEDTAARLPETLGFGGDALGPTLLAAVSGARGRLAHLIHWHASNGRGIQAGPDGTPLPVPHGLMEGLTPQEWLAAARTYRLWLRHLYDNDLVPAPFVSLGSGLLARALRAARPGVVLARAAASGELDPLTEREARLLVGA